MPNGDGLGGAGAPLGGSFTGPAQALEIIQDHVFAYSGVVAYTDQAVNAFEFTSGPYLVVGTLSVNTIDYHGDDLGLSVEFNDSVIIQQRYVTLGGTEFTQNFPWKIIIPPYTKVVVAFVNLVNTTSHTANAAITGRIYRG
jgi:hypothetical protein